MPLVDWAHRCIDRLTGIDERTRGDYHRDVDNHFSIIRHTHPAGRVVDAAICNLTADDVQDWVRAGRIRVSIATFALARWARWDPWEGAEARRQRMGRGRSWSPDQRMSGLTSM
jgi:hypothetical protein